MARKVRRVEYTLDAKGIRNLPCGEIAAILRGADDLIMQGGRSLLAKILKGSRDKKVLERKLDESPVYGFYRDVTTEQVMARIDSVILEGYLDLEYDYRLPLLVYTKKGWEIEKETYVDELLQGFDELLDGDARPFNMRYLQDRNREVILALLDKIQASGDRRYIPILAAWEEIDYKKVRKRIRQVIGCLNQGASAPPEAV
jgi:superfamily II DNA helicase RecQ